MSKSTIVKWFVGSVIGFVAGAVLFAVAAAVAVAGEVFVMNGPDVAGIRPGAPAWVVVALGGLGALAMVGAGLGQFVAWIGAVLNTADLPSKNWLVALLVIGLLGFVFVANLVYVIAGPDSHAGRMPPAGHGPSVPAARPDEPVPAGRH